MRKSQKTCFLPLFVQNKVKIDKNSKKLILTSSLDLKHPIRCCVFSFLWVFADFLNYMPNKVKNWKICWKVEFFASFGMKLKKSAKNCKNEKMQHLMGCFKSIKEFKINFWNFCLFSAYFEQKVAKNVLRFSKNCEFWSKFDITNVFLVKFPFWKCILLCTFMNLLRSYVTK